jgi:drug/metabolite transporter (DMT)-like permease
VFWLGESFSSRQAVGCALMLGAALVAQWPQKQRANRE